MEDLQVNVARLSRHLRKDLVELGKEVFEEEEDEMAPSVIRDLLDQVSEISRRYLEIRLNSILSPPATEHKIKQTKEKAVSFTG